MQTPLKAQPNEYVRRLLAKMELSCEKCLTSVPRGDMFAHKMHFCPKREGAEIIKAKEAMQHEEYKLQDYIKLTIRVMNNDNK